MFLFPPAQFEYQWGSVEKTGNILTTLEILEYLQISDIFTENRWLSNIGAKFTTVDSFQVANGEIDIFLAVYKVPG